MLSYSEVQRVRTSTNKSGETQFNPQQMSPNDSWGTLVLQAWRKAVTSGSLLRSTGRHSSQQSLANLVLHLTDLT